MAKNILILGVNDRDQEETRAWAEKEGLPFPILLDPDKSIALAYGMSKVGEERYLANSTGGRRPAVIIDEEGLVRRLLPDLSAVDEQIEALLSLPS